MPTSSKRLENMGPMVDWMYDFWRSKFGGGRRPSKNAMDPVEIAATNPAAIRHICLYDIERNPYRFRYRLVGGAIVDAGRLARVGHFMDEVDPSGRVDAEFSRICETGSPWHKIGPALIAHLTKIVAVESLDVPLSGDKDRIDNLLSFTVYHWEQGYTPKPSFNFPVGTRSPLQ